MIIIIMIVVTIIRIQTLHTQPWCLPVSLSNGVVAIIFFLRVVITVSPIAVVIIIVAVVSVGVQDHLLLSAINQVWKERKSGDGTKRKKGGKGERGKGVY